MNKARDVGGGGKQILVLLLVVLCYVVWGRVSAIRANGTFSLYCSHFQHEIHFNLTT